MVDAGKGKAAQPSTLDRHKWDAMMPTYLGQYLRQGPGPHARARSKARMGSLAEADQPDPFREHRQSELRNESYSERREMQHCRVNIGAMTRESHVVDP